MLSRPNFHESIKWRTRYPYLYFTLMWIQFSFNLSADVVNVCVALQHGNEIKMQKHKAKASISIARSPYFKWKVMKGLNKVTLSVRNLKVGTFNRIFSGPVTVRFFFQDLTVIKCSFCMRVCLHIFNLEVCVSYAVFTGVHRVREQRWVACCGLYELL